MAHRSAGGSNECYAQCPPSTVTIQPPPFVLNIPGPALYCPDQPLAIEQHNPCVGVGGGSHGGGNTSLYATGGSNICNFYSRALPNSCYGYSCYRY